jgi:hypothetical protein
MIKLHLYEGKKQAIQILGDLGNKVLPDGTTTVLKFLLAYDPTPTNKYVEVYAKYFKKEYVGGLKRGWKEDVLFDHTISHMHHYLSDMPELIEKAELKGFDQDVSKIDDIKVLKDMLKKAAIRITRSSKKFGVDGLTEDEDYKLLYENETMWALQPYSWEASKILASEYVGHCTGEWCIAYQKTDSYWNDYTGDENQAPVYMILKDDDNGGSLKFAFMYGEDDYDIWDSSDRRIYGDSKKLEVLNSLGIDKDINDTLWGEARNNASSNIDNFGSSNSYEEKLLNSIYSYNSNKAMLQDGDLGTVEGNTSIELMKFRNGEYEDSETEEFENCVGDVLLGSKFWKNEGSSLIKDLIAQNYLEDTHNFIENSLVIRYEDKTFSTIVHEMERYHYDQENSDIYLSPLQAIMKTYNITSVVILCKAKYEIKSYEDEPFIKILINKNTNEEAFTEIVMDGVSYNMVYCTKNSDLVSDYLNNDVYFSKLIKDEWVRDDDREKEMGQKFLQFEHANLMKFLKKYKQKFKD